MNPAPFYNRTVYDVKRSWNDFLFKPDNRSTIFESYGSPVSDVISGRVVLNHSETMFQKYPDPKILRA
jgi:hypothetical protein